MAFPIFMRNTRASERHSRSMENCRRAFSGPVPRFVCWKNGPRHTVLALKKIGSASKRVNPSSGSNLSIEDAPVGVLALCDAGGALHNGGAAGPPLRWTCFRGFPRGVGFSLRSSVRLCGGRAFAGDARPSPCALLFRRSKGLCSTTATSTTALRLPGPDPLIDRGLATAGGCLTPRGCLRLR